jgi:hypothetical protein
MRGLRTGVAIASFAALLVGAEVPLPELRPPRIEAVKTLGIDAGRAARVESIVMTSYEKARELREQAGALIAEEAVRVAMNHRLQALHEETDAQLAALLSADELKKLREMIPRPPRGPGSELLFRKG